MTFEQIEIFSERAAICEYHGGLIREQAEKIARDEIRRGEQGELEI